MLFSFLASELYSPLILIFDIVLSTLGSNSKVRTPGSLHFHKMETREPLPSLSASGQHPMSVGLLDFLEGARRICCFIPLQALRPFAVSLLVIFCSSSP